MKFISLRTKMMLLFCAVLIAGLGATASMLVRRERRVVREDLVRRGRVIAATVITSATTDILTEEVGNIDMMRERLEAQAPELQYLRIWNRKAQPLTRNIPASAAVSLRVRYVLETGRATQRRLAVSGRPVLEVYSPLRVGQHTYAVVCTGFSLETLRRREREIISSTAALFGSALLISIFAVTLFSGFITRPLRELTTLAGAVARGELGKNAAVRTRDEIGLLGRAFNDMLAGLRERQFIKDTFSRYVTTQVADELLRDPDRVRLGGVRQEVTVLFADIRDFTALSERLSPEEIVAQLNEYLSAMIDIVFKYEGTLDKFVGDAIMAVFGAPLSHDNDPERAVRTAIEMQERLLRLNEKWTAEGREPLHVGIGINTGEAVAGNIGDLRRMEYTVIGYTVNLASRLESLTKKYGFGIVISETTYQDVKDFVDARRREPVEIKGSTLPIAVYEILGWKSPDNPATKSPTD